MKIAIIASLLLVASICCSVPAGATSACFCVGSNRTGSCGHGGVAGNFLDVRKSIPDNLMKYLLLTQALRDTLTATKKAYDATSGWACWKE